MSCEFWKAHICVMEHALEGWYRKDKTQIFFVQIDSQIIQFYIWFIIYIYKYQVYYVYRNGKPLCCRVQIICAYTSEYYDAQRVALGLMIGDMLCGRIRILDYTNADIVDWIKKNTHIQIAYITDFHWNINEIYKHWGRASAFVYMVCYHLKAVNACNQR